MNEETHKSDESPNAVSLEHVQQRFECWRQRRKKRARIPQSLWKAAVALSREYSICHLSKALRVNYTALKKQVNKSQNTDSGTSDNFSSPFMELPVPSVSFIESTIEMIKSDGSVIRMHTKGVSCLDLVELGKTFWATKS